MTNFDTFDFTMTYIVISWIESTDSTESAVSIDARNSTDFSWLQNKYSVYKHFNLCVDRIKPKVEPNLLSQSKLIVYQQLNWISWINSNNSAVSNLSIQSNLTNWIKSSQLNKSNKTYWSNWWVATLLFPFNSYFSVHKHFRLEFLNN